jgi:hypothetical protein
MPYVTQEARDDVELAITVLAVKLRHAGAVDNGVSGLFNFTITRLLALSGALDPSYSNYQAVIGMLECIKAEIQARLVRPYEDKKCKENGDVFPGMVLHE